jgi:hypothetical protein
VGTFLTQAPTAVPSASPTASPSNAPSLSQAPTRAPSAAATSAPTTSPTEKETEVVGGGVFDNTGNALGAANGGNGNEDSDDEVSMGVIIGAAVAGLALVAFVAFFVARTLLKPNKKKRKPGSSKTAVSTEVREKDVAYDLESSGDDASASSDDAVSLDDASLDGVTVTSAASGDEVEVTAGNLLCQTPKKSSRKKNRSKIRTPPTASTLDAIEEVEDEEPGTPAGSGARVDLNAKFQDTEVQKGGAGQSKDGHIELAVGLNKLTQLADEVSVGSDESSLPPPPPSRGVTGRIPGDLHEEKKDGDSVGDEAPRALSPEPFYGMTGDQEPPTSPTFIAQVKAALKYTKSPQSPRSPQGNGPPAIAMSPSMMSTDSSLYTNEDTKSRLSAANVSPMSAVFGGVQEDDTPDQASLPDDEAFGMLQPPSLSHSYKSREGGVVAPPAAPYLNKGSLNRPKFNPKSTAAVPKVKSARTKKNLNGFTGSYLNKSDEFSNSDDEGRIRSMAAPGDSKRAPSFKRRSKREEQPPQNSNSVDVTWDSFLSDLADAEKQFFSPTHAQKSAVLRYSNESFDDDTAIDDDAATVKN